MSRIADYLIKGVTKIAIKYGDETFRFDLARELAIDETNMKEILETHAQYYGFLMTLHRRINAKTKKLKVILEGTRAKRLTKLRNTYSTVKEAEYQLKFDKAYLKALRAFEKSEDDKELLEACIRSMEVRKDLIQTLAANDRAERQRV